MPFLSSLIVIFPSVAVLVDPPKKVSASRAEIEAVLRYFPSDQAGWISSLKRNEDGTYGVGVKNGDKCVGYRFRLKKTKIGLIAESDARTYDCE